jgi:hypothetical protein
MSTDQVSKHQYFFFKRRNKHYTDGASSMHRHDLVKILKKYLPPSCAVHVNKRLTKYHRQSAGSFVLHFADDSTAITDVLIGADGIRSSVRNTLFETIDVSEPNKLRQYTDASWTGTLLYRAVFPAEKLSKMDPDNVALKDFVIVSPQKTVTIVRNNFHLQFCGKGKVDIIELLVSRTASDGSTIAHRCVSDFERNDDQCCGICF